jgi:hypothetical protein
MTNKILPAETEIANKDAIKHHFREWCLRNNIESLENPEQLLNDETLTSAQRNYIWSVIEFID